MEEEQEMNKGIKIRAVGARCRVHAVAVGTLIWLDLSVVMAGGLEFCVIEEIYGQLKVLQLD